jgi:hypothetical protein
MATSFQIAGKVRLNLTHQKTLNWVGDFVAGPHFAISVQVIVKAE